MTAQSSENSYDTKNNHKSNSGSAKLHMYGCLSNIPTYPTTFMVNLIELSTTTWATLCFVALQYFCVQLSQTNSSEEQRPLSAFSYLLWRHPREHCSLPSAMETICSFSVERSSRSVSYCLLQSKLCLRAHMGGSSRRGENTFSFTTLPSSLHNSQVNFQPSIS